MNLMGAFLNSSGKDFIASIEESSIFFGFKFHGSFQYGFNKNSVKRGNSRKFGEIDAYTCVFFYFLCLILYHQYPTSLFLNCKILLQYRVKQIFSSPIDFFFCFVYNFYIEYYYIITHTRKRQKFVCERA